jgi:hypothetical protein
MSSTRQASFRTTEQKVRAVLETAAKRDYDHVIALVSGGTDSLCALDAYDRWHADHDLPAVDLVVQTNTPPRMPTTTCDRRPPAERSERSCAPTAPSPPDQFEHAARRAADNSDLLIYKTERGYHFTLPNPEHLVALAEQWAAARHHRSARDRLQQLIETVLDLDTLDSEETQTVVAAANQALDDLPD